METTIQNLNPVTLKQLRRKINKAFSEIENEFGVKLTLGNINYTQFNASAKISIAVIDGESNQILTKEKTDWNLYAKLYNFKRKNSEYLKIGDTIIANGITYKIAGYKTRNKKFPVLLEKQDGKKVKTTKGFLLTALKK